MNIVDDLEMLKTKRLFSVLTQEQRQSVLSRSVRVKLAKDETLFNGGEKAHHFYFLKHGQLKICLNSIQGVEKVLAVMRPGDMFAEAVMFMPAKSYPATCIALKKSEVIGFEFQQFIRFLNDSNELSTALLHDLTHRLHQKVREIESLSFQNAAMRVSGYLLSLIDDKNAQSATVKLDTPKQTIASILSTTPETFSRILNQLKTKGLVELKDNAIFIPDIERLRSFVYE